MSTESWPPQLKFVKHHHFSFRFTSQFRREWVASCLGQMTDGNREESQAELRQVISDAYSSKTLWTTDWAGVQLKRCSLSGSLPPTLTMLLPPFHASLLPKPMPIMSNHTLKRKLYAALFFLRSSFSPYPATVIPQQVNLRSPKRIRRTKLLLRSRWMWVIERRSTGVRSVSVASTS